MAKLQWRRRSRGSPSAVALVGSAGGPLDRRVPRAGAQHAAGSSEAASGAVDQFPPAPEPEPEAQPSPVVWAPTATFPDAVDVPALLQSPARELPGFDDVLARLETLPLTVPAAVSAPQALPSAAPGSRATRVSLGGGADPLVPLASDRGDRP